MSEFVKNAERFVKNFSRRKNVRMASVFRDAEYWDFYCSVTGWFNGKYFMIDITVLFGEESVRLPEHVNECIEEINLILKKYNLIK